MAETKTKRPAKRPAYNGSLDNKITSCPKCGKRGKCGKWFGVRFSDGKWRMQAQCKACRGKKTPMVEYEFIVEDDGFDDLYEQKKYTVSNRLKFDKTVENVVSDMHIPLQPTTPDTLSERSIVFIDTDLERTRLLFKDAYPENKQSYGWKTMVKRLMKKFPAHILTPAADMEINGVGV